MTNIYLAIVLAPLIAAIVAGLGFFQHLATGQACQVAGHLVFQRVGGHDEVVDGRRNVVLLHLDVGKHREQ